MNKIGFMAITLAFFTTACGQLPQASGVVVFGDKPDVTFNFRHDIRIVKGTVWSFSGEGEPFIYGGPVGFITNSNTYVVEVTPKIFDIPNDRSVSKTKPSDVKDLINAANTFCEETGYRRTGTGAGIHSTDTANLLILHCLPPGVEAPTGNKIGDDVQRNPIYRALGIPPTRGLDFSK